MFLAIFLDAALLLMAIHLAPSSLDTNLSEYRYRAGAQCVLDRIHSFVLLGDSVRDQFAFRHLLRTSCEHNDISHAVHRDRPPDASS